MKLAWSTLAIEELRELRRYSVGRWGLAVASAYLADVRGAAKQVAARPEEAKHLDRRFRLVRVRSHWLIVQVDNAADRVIVARVLHTAMDLERHLPRD